MPGLALLPPCIYCKNTTFPLICTHTFVNIPIKSLHLSAQAPPAADACSPADGLPTITKTH